MMMIFLFSRIIFRKRRNKLMLLDWIHQKITNKMRKFVKTLFLHLFQKRRWLIFYYKNLDNTLMSQKGVMKNIRKEKAMHQNICQTHSEQLQDSQVNKITYPIRMTWHIRVEEKVLVVIAKCWEQREVKNHWHQKTI